MFVRNRKEKTLRGAQGGTNLKSLQSKTLISCVAIGLLAATCLAACGGQRESESQQGAANEAPSAASISAWSYADDCSLCHAAESNSLTDPACLAGIHAANGNTCQTCHADESDLAVVHEGANAEKAQKVTKLRKTGIKQDACLGCHGSYDDLAAKTADSTVLTDSEGKTVNPHALPANEDHSETTCASCHVMHTKKSVSETAPEYCISCHHANVYACHTCHD